MHKKWRRVAIAMSALSTMACAEEAQQDQWNLLTEFVYMKRAGGQNHILALDPEVSKCRHGCRSSRVLDTKDLINDFDFEPGFRVGVAYLPDVKSTYEANFLYVTQWDATESKTSKSTKEGGSGELFYPFHDMSYTIDFSAGDKAEATYKSFFYTFDLNYWRNFSRRHQDYFGLSGIFGIRYAHIKENFILSYENDTDESDYKTSTQNDIIGIQAGGAFQINPLSWFSMDLQALVGLAFNRVYSNVFLRDQDNAITLRQFRRQSWTDLVFANAAVGFEFQPLSWMNIHVGYEMLYFSGLALAPNQLSHSTTPGQTPLSTAGYAIIHGLYAGVTWSW